MDRAYVCVKISETPPPPPLGSHPVEAAVGCVRWMKSAIIFLVLLCLFVFFFHLHILFAFSALMGNIYWCGIVSHQQILMVRHAAPAEIIGAANAAPAAPVSTPMHWVRVRFGPVPLASCGNVPGVNSPTVVSFTVLSQTPRRPSYFQNSIIA